MGTRIMPTFLLKGVEVNKLLADYKAGMFANLETNTKIIITASNKILPPQYGTSNADPVFCIKDRNNCNIVVATTNHSDFQVFRKTGAISQTGGRCEYCHDDFTTTVVGYPLNFRESVVLTNENGVSKHRILYTFWVDGKFCSFECALGYIQNILARPADYRDFSHRDCERWLRLLYKLTYPNSKLLKAAPDPRLLISNGGSLTREEWQNGQHTFTRTDRVLIIPAKVEYIRHDIQNVVGLLDSSQKILTSSGFN